MKHYLCHQIKHCQLNCKKLLTKNNHFNALQKLQMSQNCQITLQTYMFPLLKKVTISKYRSYGKNY